MLNIYTDRLDMLIETKIKPNLQVIWDLKIKGLQDKNIAKAIGLTPKEFEKALERCEVFHDVYTDAVEILCGKLTDIVVGRALGTDGRTDKEGNPLPPDEKLAFKLLEKFDSRFTPKQEIKQTFSIESIIKQIAQSEEKEEVEVVENE